MEADGMRHLAQPGHRCGVRRRSGGRSATSRVVLGRVVTLCAALAAALISVVADAAEPPCTLPPAVPGRVGSAQIFSYYVDNRDGLIGRRDIIWADQGSRLPGLYSMKYMTVDRDLDPTHDAAWYEAHGRADWIARKCDGSPATEFDDSNAPVDITRPEIRQFLYDQAVAPVVKSRRYEAMAVDNVFSTNDFKRCGVERGGEFVRRYSAVRVDSAFTRDVADWLKWLGDKLHRDGMCMAGNLWYEETDIAGFRKLAALIDIVVDEGGFTRNCKANVADGHWLTRLRTMRDVAKEKPLILIDYVCPHTAGITPAVLDWSLANYLLLKGDHTYLAIRSEEVERGPLYDPPQLHVETGNAEGDFSQRNGVFYRQFERALALVNPSSTASSHFDLGSGGEWRDLNGSTRTGNMTLPPGSGVVLVKP